MTANRNKHLPLLMLFVNRLTLFHKILMLPNLALSRYLSPTEAVQWLQEKNFRTSYRAVSELMRSGEIQSIAKNDYAVGKRPRIVTTEAALELWLESKFKAAKRENTTTKLEAASARAIREKVELAQIPNVFEQNLEKTLNLNRMDSYLDTKALKALDEAERLKELRRQKRAEKQERKGANS